MSVKEKNHVARTTINTLSLCSGVGMLDEGVAFALERFGFGHRTAAYAEWEGYPAQQLVSLMESGAMDSAPVWCGDFADLNWQAFHGLVDAFIAGYPCQAWSTAGKRLGFADKRWVWGHIEHGLSIVRPRFVFLENVRGLISGGGLGATIAGLSRLGYDTEWSTLYASTVGASHQRDRIFIFGFLADSVSGATRGSDIRRRNSGAGDDGARTGNRTQRPVADDTRIRRRGEPAARQQPDARLHGKGVVHSDGELQQAWRGSKLQSRAAAHAGHQVEHRERAPRKPEGKASGKGRSRASQLVDWAEELLFAPGQNDPRWNQIIRERPDLRPTLERDVRSMVNGVAAVLGKRFGFNHKDGSGKLASSRAKKLIDELMNERERMLRCAGNGVVPQQAAVAYTELMRRAGIC